MITIEQAIKHCREKAEELREKAKHYGFYTDYAEKTQQDKVDCLECANEHEQLAEWLEELVELRKDKRPKGKWIKVKGDEMFLPTYKCSVCKEQFPFEGNMTMREVKKYIHFCSNCGADMRGDKE